MKKELDDNKFMFTAVIILATLAIIIKNLT